MALVIPGSVIDLERIEAGDGIATADGMRVLLQAVNTLFSRPRAIEQLGQQTVGVVSTAVKLGDINGGDTGTTTDAGIGIELGEKTVGSGLTDKWALINGRDAFGPFVGLYNVTNGKCVWKAYAEGSTLALSPPIDGTSAMDTNAIGGTGTQRWDEGWFADLNVSGDFTLGGEDLTLTYGTWTPVLGDDAGTPSGQAYDHQAGVYAKIGRLVVAWYTIFLNTKGTFGGSEARLRDLPFTCENTLALTTAAMPAYFANLATNVVQVLVAPRANEAHADILIHTGAAGSISRNMVPADIADNTILRGLLVYRTA